MHPQPLAHYTLLPKPSQQSAAGSYAAATTAVHCSPHWCVCALCSQHTAPYHTMQMHLAQNAGAQRMHQLLPTRAKRGPYDKPGGGRGAHCCVSHLIPKRATAKTAHPARCNNSLPTNQQRAPKQIRVLLATNTHSGRALPFLLCTLRCTFWVHLALLRGGVSELELELLGVHDGRRGGGQRGQRPVDEGLDGVGLGPHRVAAQDGGDVGGGQGGHAGARPQRRGGDVRDDDGVGAVGQPRLHGGLVLKHVQPAPEVGVGAQVRHQRGLVNHGAARRVDQHRILLHHVQAGRVHEVVRGLVQVAVQRHHVGLLEHLLHRLHAPHRHGRLAVVAQQLAVLPDVVLQLLVGVRVVVHKVHLVPLHHHARVGRADAARSDDAHSLVLQQVAHKQGGQPPLVPARAHEHVCLRHAARSGQGEGSRQLGSGLRQHTWCVAHRDTPLCCLLHLHVVVANSIVGVGLASCLLQGLKQLTAPVLGQLPDHTITLVANEGLDGGVAQDGVRVLADLNPAVCLLENVEPPVSWQGLGHNHPLLASLIVHLNWNTIGGALGCKPTHSPSQERPLLAQQRGRGR
mmetsp:Transcript_16288/g.40525  ORF Transcript_16288/g.40525 Transcript_16288/m.40525 type:complete len:572 (+) Transcript_16288:104-1819(+)